MTPVFLSLHGALLLRDSHTVILQWVLVAATGALGLLGLAGRRSVSSMRVRAWLLAILTWALLYITGGVAAFFTLWYFMLAAVYPLVLGGKAAYAYSIVIGAAYLVLAPISETELVPAVLLGRAAVITAIGLVIAAIAAGQRRAALALLSEKDDFVASVSHELRTPLTAVIGFAAELQDLSAGIEPPEIQEFAGAVHRQSMEVAGIVEDLLVSARAGGGRLSIVPAGLELRSEVQRVVTEVELIYGRPGADMDIGDSVVSAIADPSRVRQIVRNLVVNAIRHGGPQIQIRVREQGARAVVEVCDDGPGIPLADLDRLFTPYQRFHRDLGKPDSIGLGLAVSRTLALLMDGDLTHHRSEGWTVFRLDLPGGDGFGSSRDAETTTVQPA
jgi:signal transduction histidine kinase